MKRLIKKAGQNDKEIADFVFENAKEAYDWNTELVEYTKNAMNRYNVTIEDLKEDSYEANSLFSSVLQQYQGIYDATSDRFFPERNTGTEDIIFENSGLRSQITNYIANLSDYTDKSWQDLLNDQEIATKLS